MEDIKSIEQFFDYHMWEDPDCKEELELILKKAKSYLSQSDIDKIMLAYEFAKKAMNKNISTMNFIKGNH